MSIFLSLLPTILGYLMTAAPKTTASGTVSTAVVNAVSSAITTGTTQTGTLASLVFNLRMAKGAMGVAAVANALMNTPALPMGAFQVGEQLVADNTIADPSQRRAAIDDAISQLAAINSQVQAQLGPVSRLFASFGL